ncbi:hypothetical protein GCM10023201_50320 [Actinomycetospora corticicola]|uniref:Magnesium-transporting ATPase (P-type) n=1 Tax=Actinomycetospora corticicola TaxID=663602 RepID=A0A7Y9DY54_9PSEU|nr:hypothetical protein [Actinomycetospora corticicola]NYD37698.1 magnesium-transporting ATPase (P-type) [Actinomycetospora corticicola]
MKRYVLHARLFAGPLCSPVKNELQAAEGDDLAALEELADDYRERGFRVWVYERRSSTFGGVLSLHVLTER